MGVAVHDLVLRDPQARRRLTRPAVPAVMTLGADWHLTDQQAADLLGGVTLPDAALMFGGRTPLEAMTRGGIPAMERVRAHLDTVRGGR